MSRILTDLKAPRFTAQHSGQVTLIQRQEPIRPRPVMTYSREGVCLDKARFTHIDAGYVDDRFGMSEGSEDMCKGKPLKPDLPVRKVRGLTYAKRAKLLVSNKKRQRPPKRLYVPVAGNQAGPLFGFYDRGTGARYATCRGVIHHVMKEAEKFAQAMGGKLSDLHVRIVEEQDDATGYVSE